MKAIFFDLSSTPVADKAPALLKLVETTARGSSEIGTVFVDPSEFREVPGAPFCFWAARASRLAFARFSRLEVNGRVAKRGVNSNDDFRFIRDAWETSGAKWVPHAKGGSFSRFYAAIPLVLNWGEDGRELLAERVTDRIYKSAIVPSRHLYGRPGITWSLRTTKAFSARLMSDGVVFGSKGPAIIVDGNIRATIAALLGVLNSRAFGLLVSLQVAAADAAARSYEVGVLQQTPVPDLNTVDTLGLSLLAHRAWSLKRSLDTITEISHAFHLPALLQVEGPTLAHRAAAWSTHVAGVEAELAAIQGEIDDHAFRLYGIEGEDRARIEAESGAPPATPADEDEAADPEEEAEEEDESAAADATTLAQELFAWAVGVAFGRFDVRLAVGSRVVPTEPEPFDPLPACSPGMLTGPDGLPTVTHADYPLELPDILVDDPGHPADLDARVTDVFRVVFGDAHEARLEEAVTLAGAPNFRTFLRRDFFAFHLKRYSKSRRRAPIWWPLSTPSGNYTIWLAWPRMTRDTLHRAFEQVRNKVGFEERKLTGLRQDAGPTPTTRQSTDIATQEDFVGELTTLRDELLARTNAEERGAAVLWNPVHDDGVILHFALLWRVVRDAAWQKECRAAWEKLADGSYDWAHIAMHLWPERVVPKCRADRSLAIAHGLESTFWVETDGKWRLRETPDREAARLVIELTSPPIQAAFALLRAHGTTQGAATWWDALQAGNHDDAPAALRLWPGRVMERCQREERLALAHQLPGLHRASLHDPMNGRRGRTWNDDLGARLPVLMASLVGAFDHAVGMFGAGTVTSWPEFWAALDTGALETTLLARMVRPAEVVARARADVDFAELHGIADPFWLEDRLRVAPDTEAADAIAARSSAAVKTALRAFIAAPPPARAGRGKGVR